MVYAGVAR